MFSADYSEKIVSEQNEVDETTSVSGLSLATGYKISMALESESLNAYYGGSFIIQAELDSTLAVDLFYQFAGMDGDAAPYADDLNESEPRNNTASTPDFLLSSRTMIATTKNGDVDYFRFYCPTKMTGSNDDEVDYSGMLNISFTLNVPAWVGICMECRDWKGRLVSSVISSTTESSGTTYTLKINNADRESFYEIKITSTTAAAIYRLTASHEYKLAWFGQYVSKDADGEYWNTNKLDKLYNHQYPVFKELNKDIENYNGDVFATACGVVSAAMIFKNLGATMNGYDFRIGYEGKLQADPFTAMLSNCGLDGTGQKTDETNLNYDGWADGLKFDNIGEKFGLSYMWIGTDDTSLRNAIKKYGSVLVRFNDGEKGVQHFMVLTGLGTGSTFVKKAIVYDPASKTYAKGAEIPLTETSWYYGNFVIKNKVFKLSYAVAFY